MTEATYDGVASWDELCPDGASRFYEGDDPDGFAVEMLEGFDLDVRAPDPGVWDRSRQFFIPAGLVGAIYGSERWPLGS